MDYYALTSQEVLDRLARHCPRAISTYLQCINRADKNGKSFFTKEIIIFDISDSYTKFKNNLKALARENLLEWHLIDEGIIVSLIDQGDE